MLELIIKLGPEKCGNTSFGSLMMKNHTIGCKVLLNGILVGSDHSSDEH